MTNISILHDSHKTCYRSPFGAVPCNEVITLQLEIETTKPVEMVTLRLWKQHREERVEMQVAEDMGHRKIFRAQISSPPEPGLLWYFFIATCDQETYYYGNNTDNLGGVGQLYFYEPPSYQVTVYKKEAATPNWYKDAIMYQIFVDRFCNGYDERKILNPKNHCVIYPRWDDVPVYGKCPQTGKTVCYDCFGGNLLGVIKKLPYIKELGINVIYLNPIFEASSNHKYDTGDYKRIDPMFGNNQVFKELCTKAKNLGISIILDGVFSHTGSDSIYFNREGNYPSLGAYQSKESPYYSWYRFEKHPEKYDCWWDIDTLPNVNEMDPSYQKYIITGESSVIKYWMKTGAKGWRLDVVDELPGEFVKNIFQTMKETDPESVLIGEVWEDASNKMAYGKFRDYLLGDELDSVMNYPFRNILLDFFRGRKDARQTHLAFMRLYENYPLQYFYATMNIIGTHDVERALTILSGAPEEHTLSKEEQARYKLTPEQMTQGIAKMKLISLFQMSFPGVPCIYYGDEAGMQGYKDPLNRATYPWGKEDKQLLNWYKKIISIRTKYDVLRTGKWLPLIAEGYVYGFIRLIENGVDVFNQRRQDNVAVVLFNTDSEQSSDLTIDLSRYCRGNMTEILTGQKTTITNGLMNISLQPLEGKLYIDGGK